MWEDRTIAYTVRYLHHRLSGIKEAFPLCGVLNAEPPEEMADNNVHRSANRWINTFEMFACSFRSNPFLPFLCEYSEQPYPRSFQHTASLTLAKLGTATSSGLTVCPSNHSVHDFLACDSLSHCWALQPLSFGGSPESWDIPSARTCPVVMTSLPPSYECQRGGQRVPYSLVCDHRQDCVDSSDEDFCGYTSRPGQIRCGRGKQSYQPSRRCDAQKDCVHGGDEMLCDNYSLMCANNHLLPPPSPPAVVTFTAKCYTVSTMSETHSASGPASCPDTHYQCPQGYCLPVFTRCNGVYDCPHWHDEAGCEHYRCPGYYRCRGSSVCTHPSHICDGVNHCPQSDDELLCDLHCPSVCTCHGLAFTCPQLFPVEQYEDLRYLKARGSGMTMEQLSSNMMLVYLSLADCQVSAIGNVSFPNMATLDVSDNHITSLTSIVHKIPHLKALFLSNNPLSNFLYRNHLQREAFTYPPCQISTSVEVLVLSGIELQTLNDRIGHLFPSAQRLNVSGCGTQRVTQQALQLMSQLQELDLTGCPMEDIQENILGDLTHLTSVRGDNYKLCCAAGLLKGFNLNNCYAPKDEISSCSDLLRSNVYRIVLALFASLAILGNVVSGVFRMVTVRQGGAAGFSVFVVHLCGSDLLMGLYLAVIGMADRMHQDVYVWEDVSWRHSVVCQLAGFMSLVSSEVSAFIICFITLDRLLVVRFPLSFLRFKGSHANLASCACWFMGILLAAVPFSPFTTHWDFYSQTGICIPLPVTRKQFAGHQYALAVMVVINFTLFLIIALGQAVIFHSVRANQMIGAQTGQSSQDAHIARRLLTIAMSDFLCWFPIGLTGLLASQGVPVSGEVNVAMAVLVLPLNSAINPFLYTLNVLIEKQHKAREDKLLRWIQSQG